MATRARGGGTGMAVALVVFVLLFVFSLIAAIVIFTKVEEAELKAADAQKALDIYIKPAEVSRDDVKKLRDSIAEDKSNQSVVSRLMADNMKLRDTIVANLPSVRALPEYLKAKKVGDGTPLLSHIENLQSDVATLKGRETTAAATVKSLQDQIAALEKEKTEIEERYRTADKKRADEISTISDANNTAKTSADTSFKTLREAQEAAAEEAKKQVDALAQTITEKDQRIADLLRELERIKLAANPGGDKGTSGAEREIDGALLSIIPSDNLVTIDLGKKDHVPLGLTFEVFDKKTGVTREFNEIRGKATIEVVRVKETSSECRVVRQERGKTLMVGDVIANLVYDRYRTYKFFVHGNFDIDNDGRPSPTDTRRIKSMIEQWGGEVATEFAYDVDFLVLGVRPQARPRVQGDTDIRTPDEIEADLARERDELAFTQLEGLARQLRVPVLNQNRFLSLIGYYQRQ